MTLTETDRLAVIEEKLERLTAAVDGISELTTELSAMSGDVLLATTDRLAEADRRGYFEFARAAGGVADRIVTGYTAEDVEALGDNIVLILNTIREMTQPEVMGMLQRTAHTVRQEEPEELGLIGFIKKTREPEVKRGLGRLVVLLRNLGGDARGGI